MKVTTEELERCEVLMTVEIEPKQEQDLLQKAAKKIARQIHIPGFRPGKAPYNVVVRRFGLEAIQQEALEQSADKVIQEALEEANIQPFAQISLESINWAPLTIKIKVPTSPKVELSDYRTIRLESKEAEVNNDEVEAALQNLQEQHATWNPVERPAQMGDLITMSVVEKDGDEVLVERESVEHELSAPQEPEEAEEDAGETTAQSLDFTTPLLGLSAGDEKTFSLTYPEDFPDQRYAGKEITFEVKVSSVKEKELDPLDDEFAKSVSDFDTLEELKANISENIKKQHGRQQDIELGNEVLEKVVAESKVEWPLAFETESVEQELKTLERRAETTGLSLEQYLQIENKTKETFEAEIRDKVVQNLKHSLVVGKIAEMEKVRVSESEVLQRAKLLSDLSGRGEQLWRSILGSQAQQSIIASDILVEKVIQALAAIAKGEEPNDEAAEEAAVSEEAEDTSAVLTGTVEPAGSPAEVEANPEETQEPDSPPDGETDGEPKNESVTAEA